MKKMGRLAMREEGDNWVAYYAMPDTMDKAIWLGAIKLKFVHHAERRLIFMELMKAAVSDLVEEAIGERPLWPDGPQSAPQHEKAGRA